MNNNKLPFWGVLLVFVAVLACSSVLAAPDMTLSSTSGTIDVDQGDSKTLTFDIENTGTDDFTNVKLIYSTDSFTDMGNNEVQLIFSDNDFVLNAGNIQTIIITATPDMDQYLGELTGAIEIKGTTASDSLTKSFSLTVDTTSEMVDVTLDDDNLDDLQPGEEMQFDIEVDNLYNKDLENVKVKAWIVDIDDNDDLDDESSKVDIDRGDDDKFDFTFTVPLNVDENDFDIKVRVEGEDEDNNDFEVIKVFKNVVEVVKDEDEEVQLDNLQVSSLMLECGSLFTVDVDVINTGEDDLDEMYLKLEIEGTSISMRSEEFDLESDDYDDREENVDFRVTLPDDLDREKYQLKILAYNEDHDLIGGEYQELTVTPCSGVSEEETETFEQETRDTSETEEEGTVFLPTGFTTFGLDKDTWSTIFWIIGDVVLVLIAIYFIVLITKRARR